MPERYDMELNRTEVNIVSTFKKMKAMRLNYALHIAGGILVFAVAVGYGGHPVYGKAAAIGAGLFALILLPLHSEYIAIIKKLAEQVDVLEKQGRSH